MVGELTFYDLGLERHGSAAADSLMRTRDEDELGVDDLQINLLVGEEFDVYGYVHDGEGNPVENITVFLQTDAHEKIGFVSKDTTTDENGEFEFTNISNDWVLQTDDEIPESGNTTLTIRTSTLQFEYNPDAKDIINVDYQKIPTYVELGDENREVPKLFYYGDDMQTETRKYTIGGLKSQYNDEDISLNTHSVIDDFYVTYTKSFTSGARKDQSVALGHALPSELNDDDNEFQDDTNDDFDVYYLRDVPIYSPGDSTTLEADLEWERSEYRFSVGTYFLRININCPRFKDPEIRLSGDLANPEFARDRTELLDRLGLTGEIRGNEIPIVMGKPVILKPTNQERFIVDEDFHHQKYEWTDAISESETTLIRVYAINPIDNSPIIGEDVELTVVWEYTNDQGEMEEVTLYDSVDETEVHGEVWYSVNYENEEITKGSIYVYARFPQDELWMGDEIVADYGIEFTPEINIIPDNEYNDTYIPGADVDGEKYDYIVNEETSIYIPWGETYSGHAKVIDQLDDPIPGGEVQLILNDSEDNYVTGRRSTLGTGGIHDFEFQLEHDEEDDETGREWLHEARFTHYNYENRSDSVSIVPGLKPSMMTWESVPSDGATGITETFKVKLFLDSTTEVPISDAEVTLRNTETGNEVIATTDENGIAELDYTFTGEDVVTEEDITFHAKWDGNNEYGGITIEHTINSEDLEELEANIEFVRMPTTGIVDNKVVIGGLAKADRNGTEYDIVNQPIDIYIPEEGTTLDTSEEEYTDYSNNYKIATVETETKGVFRFVWDVSVYDPRVEQDEPFADVDPFDIGCQIDVDGYEIDTHSYGEEGKDMNIERKTPTLDYDYSDNNPVPYSDIEDEDNEEFIVEGMLMEGDELSYVPIGDFDLKLHINDVKVAETETDTDIVDEGMFDFSISKDEFTDGVNDLKLKVVEDSDEFKDIEEEWNIEVEKEQPKLSYSLPETVYENELLRHSIFLISEHGGDVSDREIVIKQVVEGSDDIIVSDSNQAINSDNKTNENGYLAFEQEMTKGEYEFYAVYEAETTDQFLPSETDPQTIKVIEEPDYSKPDFRVKHSDNIYTSDVKSINVDRETRAKSDTFRLEFDNENGKYNDTFDHNDDIEIELRYKGNDFEDLPLMFSGYIENINTEVDSTGDTIILEGFDESEKLKNRVIYDRIYRKEDGWTPQKIITKTDEEEEEDEVIKGILDFKNIYDDFDIDKVIAPDGWPNRITIGFSDDTIYSALDDLRERSEALKDMRYKLIIKPKRDSQDQIIFRPDPEHNPMASKPLKIGDNIINAEFNSVDYELKNRVKVIGDYETKKRIKPDEYDIEEQPENIYTHNDKKYMKVNSNYKRSISIPYRIREVNEIEIIPLYGLSRDDISLEDDIVEEVSYTIDSDEDYTVNEDVGIIELSEDKALTYGDLFRVEYKADILHESGWVEDTDSIDKHGLNEYIRDERIKGVTDEEDLNEIANSILNEYKDSKQEIELETLGMLLAYPGDDIKLEKPSGGGDVLGVFDGADEKIYTINKVEYNFTRNSGFTTRFILLEKLKDIEEIIANLIDMWDDRDE